MTSVLTAVVILNMEDTAKLRGEVGGFTTKSGVDVKFVLVTTVWYSVMW